MNNFESDTFWSRVDGSLVINLDKREDRWFQVSKTLEGFIPRGKFERLSAGDGKAVPG